jgi:hypothetical protein
MPRQAKQETQANEDPLANLEDAPAPRAKKLKTYTITFHGEGGDVEIGHNYKMNLYKRNVPTTIDENYLNVLKASVVTTQIQDSDGNWKAVSIPTFQYTLESGE